MDDVLSVYEATALAAAGVVMDAPGLPYPPMLAPHYRMVEAGGWQLHQPFLIACAGYFLPPRRLSWTNTVLTRDGISWMSLTPAETESQMPHLAAARGVVVVCVLGLVVMAYSVSALRAVTRLIVVERDPEIITAFHAFSDFERWPQRDKIELVQCDARDFRRDGVDFLYADIWPYYRMDAMVEDMKAIHRNVPAPACGYWGQELDMVDAALARGVALEDFSAGHVQAFAASLGLPLIGLEQPGYPELCKKAALNPALGAKRRA